MTNDTDDVSGTQPMGKCRRVIPATCALHRGPMGFTNLVVSERGSAIELDPHATGTCKITLEQDGVWLLRDMLVKWLG